MAPSNSYSPDWFEFFHATIPGERTEKEVGFICEVAPLPEFRKVLDVCCGTGRHARALAERGYSVTGIERDPAAIARAQELSGGPNYVQFDVREYAPEIGTSDLVIIMSQSFGYFEPAQNGDLLARLSSGLRKRGRIVLDLWNPEFFLAHQDERELATAAGVVRETKRVSDGRLIVNLTYPNGGEERFDWQLFTPSQMRSFAERRGLEVALACTEFDPSIAPRADNLRIQFVLERR